MIVLLHNQLADFIFLLHSSSFSALLHKKRVLSHPFLLICQSSDIGSQGVHFLHQALISPLNKVDILHFGSTLGSQTCDDQRCAGPQIMGSYHCARQIFPAADNGGLAADENIRAHIMN